MWPDSIRAGSTPLTARTVPLQAGTASGTVNLDWLSEPGKLYEGMNFAETVKIARAGLLVSPPLSALELLSIRPLRKGRRWPSSDPFPAKK
jgi:hypothetical protein